jgi:hypothetical protein
VRQSAVFSGMPITERLPEQERTCGVNPIALTSCFLNFFPRS